MTAPAPVVPPTVTTPPTADPTDPADVDGYKALVEKLRDEVKAAKADHTPQDEKDAATIAALKRQVKEAEPILKQWQELEEASKSELEKAQAAAAKAAERATGFVKRAVIAEIRAAATGFADPSDAVAFLSDTTKYADENGEINTDAIKTDLADLLKRKPHLAAQGGTRAPLPDPTLTGRPARPEDIDQQIAEAEKAGNYGLSISLKRQKAAAAATKK